jgi:hypothetical protein
MEIQVKRKMKRMGTTMSDLLVFSPFLASWCQSGISPICMSFIWIWSGHKLLCYLLACVPFVEVELYLALSYGTPFMSWLNYMLCYVCSRRVNDPTIMLYHCCVLYDYWISCAHVDHVIKSRGSSSSWCVLCIQMQNLNRAHS